MPTDISAKVFIVMPAYNEATKIASVIEGLLHNNCRNIIVCDDNSQDTTGEIARQKGNWY